MGMPQILCCREIPRGLSLALGGLQATFKALNPASEGARLRNLSGEDPDPKFCAHRLWNKIAEAYSSSLLTFEDDKLIALSRIAKRQQSQLNEQYIAGLRKNFLRNQLLWEA